MANFMDMDELDAETIQQIIDMEERSKNMFLDEMLAQQFSTDNNDDDWMNNTIDNIEHNIAKTENTDIIESRQLREQQDREYEASLLQDQQKSILKNSIEKEEKNQLVEENFIDNTIIEKEQKKLSREEMRLARLKKFQ